MRCGVASAVALAIGTSIAAGCSQSEPKVAPAPARSPPAAVEGDPFFARCRAAAEYSRRCNGEVLVILRDGKPVLEDAVNGFTVDTRHLLASGTKSFSGIAAALAVDDGLLRFDERVSDTITEWKADPRKSAITVRQLLSLSSGLESLGSKIDNPRNARAAGIADRAKASIDARLLADPGERFIYGPSSFYVFGELMRRKLSAAATGDRDVVAYLGRRVFDPIGIGPRFARDEAGNANLPGGCTLGARDWAAFGELVRNRGVHAGARIVSEEALAEILRPQGSGPRAAYGLTWWIVSDGPDGADPEDQLAFDMAAERLEEQGGAMGRRMADRVRDRGRSVAAATERGEPLGVMAAGKGKQRLYVLPKHGLTVVRFGPLEAPGGFEDSEFLRLLLGT